MLRVPSGDSACICACALRERVNVCDDPVPCHITLQHIVTTFYHILQCTFLMGKVCVHFADVMS